MACSYLCKVFTDILGCGSDVVAEGAGGAGLAGALTEEFAGNVCGVWGTTRSRVSKKRVNWLLKRCNMCNCSVCRIASFERAGARGHKGRQGNKR